VQLKTILPLPSFQLLEGCVARSPQDCLKVLKQVHLMFTGTEGHQHQACALQG